MTSSIHCFAIPALHPEPAQSELNLFLAQERVLALRREFIADGANLGCSVASALRRCN